MLPNAETQEQLYPVRVVRQEFRCDAAGAGAYRGGSGIDYEVEYLDDAEFSFRAEGIVRPRSFGCNGGGAGAAGHVSITTADGTAIDAPAYGVQRFARGRLRVVSPAGGGWGHPFDRDPHATARDVRDGLISEWRALEQYGVVLSPGGALDEAAAGIERARRSRDRD